MCAQRRLRSAWASAKSDQSSLRAQSVAKDRSFLHADSEDTDQSGRMLGAYAILLVLSCAGSNINEATCERQAHGVQLFRDIKSRGDEE